MTMQVEADVAQWHEHHYRFTETYDPQEVTPEGKLTPAYHAARLGYAQARIFRMAEYLPEIHSLLDVGCGGGTFLAQLKGTVPVLLGIDVAQDLCDACAEVDVSATKADFLTWQPGRTWDAVTAFHVLEHVKDVHGFIRKASACADKYLFIEIPCKGNRDKKFAGHVQSFSQESFLRLLETTGRKFTIRTGAVPQSLFAVVGGRA